MLWKRTLAVITVSIALVGCLRTSAALQSPPTVPDAVLQPEKPPAAENKIENLNVYQEAHSWYLSFDYFYTGSPEDVYLTLASAQSPMSMRIGTPERGRHAVRGILLSHATPGTQTFNVTVRMQDDTHQETFAGGMFYRDMEFQERFGWQYECDSAMFKDNPVCTTNALGTKEVVVHYLNELWQAQQWSRLELGLKDLDASCRRTFRGDSAHDAIAETFKDINPPVADSIAKQWLAAVPTSSFAHYVKARAAYNKAWSMRGRGYAASVSDESWELFFAGLEEAERILNEAPAELEASPLWYQLMIAIHADMPVDRSKAEQLFNQGIARWPTNFEFYRYRMLRLQPKWGGSWEMVDSAVRQWTKKVEATEGRSLYARLYLELFENTNATPGETDVDWTLLNQSFNDLVERYPAGGFRLYHAAYACAARDKPTFLSVLESIRAHRESPSPQAPLPWLDGHSFEACMLWSGQCTTTSACTLHPQNQGR